MKSNENMSRFIYTFNFLFFFFSFFSISLTTTVSLRAKLFSFFLVFHSLLGKKKKRKKKIVFLSINFSSCQYHLSPLPRLPLHPPFHTLPSLPSIITHHYSITTYTLPSFPSLIKYPFPLFFPYISFLSLFPSTLSHPIPYTPSPSPLQPISLYTHSHSSLHPSTPSPNSSL